MNTAGFSSSRRHRVVSFRTASARFRPRPAASSSRTLGARSVSNPACSGDKKMNTAGFSSSRRHRVVSFRTASARFRPHPAASSSRTLGARSVSNPACSGNTAGFEPTTSASGGQRSIQLSYASKTMLQHDIEARTFRQDTHFHRGART